MAGIIEQQAYELETLLEKRVCKPLGPAEGCTGAELYRLMDLIYIESCRGSEGSEPCRRLLRIANDIKAWSLDELRSKLGI